MQNRTITPHLVLIGLMVLAALALAFTVGVSLNDQAGVRMQLPATLEGGWVGDELRYSHNPENPQQYQVSQLALPNVDPVTGDKLFTMSLAEYDALPHDTAFVKSIYTNPVADPVFVAIVLSGKEGSASIHRPQRCLIGQGNSIMKTKTIKIPLEGRAPLKVCILETVRNYRGKDGERKAYLGYYAYWFVGHGRETPSHYERMFWVAWDRIFHNLAHKWAYIAVSGERQEGTETYREPLTEFIQKLYPHLLLSTESHGGQALVETGKTSNGTP